MKRFFRSVVLFSVSLIAVSFLPLYIARTMTRSQTLTGGDVIDYDWKIRTLYGYISEYDYFRPEEHFALYLAVNIVLAFIYAFIVSGGIFLLTAFVKGRKAKADFQV